MTVQQETISHQLSQIMDRSKKVYFDWRDWQEREFQIREVLEQWMVNQEKHPTDILGVLSQSEPTPLDVSDALLSYLHKQVDFKGIQAMFNIVKIELDRGERMEIDIYEWRLHIHLNPFGKEGQIVGRMIKNELEETLTAWQERSEYPIPITFSPGPIDRILAPLHEILAQDAVEALQKLETRGPQVSQAIHFLEQFCV